MIARDFAYWLQGLFELQPDVVEKGLTPEQTKLVQQHLALVFRHDIDPSYSPDPKVQAELQDIHDGKVVTPRPKKRPPPAGGLGTGVVYRC